MSGAPSPGVDAPTASRGPLWSADPRARLLVLSFLMLLVELALIRWTGSRIVYLSYFSNFVLLGSFLGIGIGFLRARARVNLFPLAAPALAGLVLFVALFPVRIDRSGEDLIFFGHFFASGLPIWVTLPAIFVAVAAVMALIGEGVAREFKRFRALEAYRLDVVGSLAGIVGFSLLAFLNAPPVAWGVAAALGFGWLALANRSVWRVGVLVLSSVVLVGALAVESMAPDTEWSPYYKVEVHELDGGVLDVSVNGIPHQAMMPLEQRREREPFYFYPYVHRNATGPPAQVLIVGAGTGSDVAIALDQGVAHVDAVEIDPQLQALGERLHPDRPYQDPRVEVHIDDGRAFLERTDRTYDLILFALPDSLTLVSGQSSLRLESFLFTAEAMADARDHLAPGGVFAMYNYYREDWLVDRLANTLQATYGQAPCIDRFGKPGEGLAVLAVSVDPDALTCATPWTPTTQPVTPPATDDRPFLYLREARIPTFYLVTIGLILVASVAMVRVAAGPLRPMRSYLDLFFMGVAFLLLETKSVVQYALLFGTTWFVNALVFAGILLSVLAAIEVTRRVRFRRPALLYGFLMAALAVAWVIPASALIDLPAVPRFVVATLVAFTPVFLANLVFAERFRKTADTPAAFGANLLGAMVGGLVEYLSLVTGYQALLVITAAVYGLAFLAGRRHLGESASPS